MIKRSFGFIAFIIIFLEACNTNPNAALEVQKEIDSVKVDGHPGWIMQGNIYEVNVRQYTAEGTFKAFENSLQRLKNMGVQTLWFMPINPISKKDRKGTLGSYYAVSNYTAINPEFGNMADWKALVERCHDMGFKVIIDWVPNHTGGDHYWLSQHPDYYLHDSITGKAISQFDWSDTRKLNYNNPELVDSMINCMKYWIIESDIDGFRCDQAHLVPENFWKKSITELKKLKNIVMVAESEEGWVHDAGFDLSYPWKFFHAMVGIANGTRNALYLDSIKHFIDSTFPANALFMYFTSNHDENSWNKADYGTMPGASHAPFAVLTQTMAKSIPLIYSGQEEPFLDSLSFFYKDTIKFEKFNRAEFYRILLSLRQKNTALNSNATFIKIKTNDSTAVYAYMRQSEKNKVLVLLNFSNRQVEFKLNSHEPEGAPLNVFSGKAEEIKNGQIFHLSAWGYAVYSY